MNSVACFFVNKEKILLKVFRSYDHISNPLLFYLPAENEATLTWHLVCELIKLCYSH